MKSVGLLLSIFIVFMIIDTYASEDADVNHAAEKSPMKPGYALDSEKQLPTGIILDEWLSEEHKEVISELARKGENATTIKSKIMEYYVLLPSEILKVWRANYKQKCIEWMDKVASEAEMKEIKEFYTQEKIGTLLKKVVKLSERLDKHDRNALVLWQDQCIIYWNLGNYKSIAEVIKFAEDA